MATIIVYITSVTGNLEIKKKQQRIDMILSKDYKGNKVEYRDVASSEENKQKMREGMGDPKGLPPQIFNGDTYCGNFESFDNAIEEDSLDEFLKLK